MKQIHLLVNKQNLAHEVAPVATLDRHAIEGEMFVGEQIVCCPVATRIDVLENILDSVTNNIFYKLVLYNDKMMKLQAK